MTPYQMERLFRTFTPSVVYLSPPLKSGPTTVLTTHTTPISPSPVHQATSTIPAESTIAGLSVSGTNKSIPGNPTYEGRQRSPLLPAVHPTLSVS